MLLLSGFLMGCGKGKEEVIEVKNSDIMKQVKSTLLNYANGKPLSSEVTSFEYMVNEVKKVDAAKADILKTGLDDLKNTKGSPAAKAKALLKKLGMSEMAD